MFLAVVDDGQAQISAVSEGQPHQGRIIYRVAVVAKTDTAGGGQFLQIGQLAPGPAFANAADDQHAHRGRRAALPHIVHNGGVVNGGVGVGHGADSGKAAAGRRRRAGSNGFLVLKARLAQMGMDINKAGADHHSGGIDNPNVVGRGGVAHAFPDGGDDAVVYQHVGNAVKSAGRVNYPPAGNQQRAIIVIAGSCH